MPGAVPGMVGGMTVNSYSFLFTLESLNSPSVLGPRLRKMLGHTPPQKGSRLALRSDSRMESLALLTTQGSHDMWGARLTPLSCPLYSWEDSAWQVTSRREKERHWESRQGSVVSRVVLEPSRPGLIPNNTFCRVTREKSFPCFTFLLIEKWAYNRSHLVRLL